MVNAQSLGTLEGGQESDGMLCARGPGICRGFDA